MLRVAWFIAGLLFVLWGGESTAQSCPDGQVLVWTCTGVTNNGVYGVVHSCVGGNAHASAAEAVMAHADQRGSSGCHADALPAGAPTFSSRAPNGLSERWHQSFIYFSPGTNGQCAGPYYDDSFYYNVSATCGVLDPDPDLECPEAGTSAGAFSIESSDGFGACLDEGGASCSIRARGVAVALGASDVWYATEWVHSGESCGGAETPIAANDCETVNGNNVCKHPSNGRCIVINGEDVCSSDAGGVCAVGDCLPWYADDQVGKLPDGAQFAHNTTPTPPAPNDGTEGQRATPDVELQAGRQGGGPGNVYDIDYWNAGTVGNSTADSGDHTGDGEDPNEKGNCFDNDSGEPCKVKIDEEGTPETYEGEFDYDPEDTAGDIQDIAEQSPADDMDWSGSVPTVAPGACSPLSLTASTSRGPLSWHIVGSSDCSKMAGLRAVFAWALYAMTALYCIKRVLEEI